jgi:hypothetical protein
VVDVVLAGRDQRKSSLGGDEVKWEREGATRCRGRQTKEQDQHQEV